MIIIIFVILCIIANLFVVIRQLHMIQLNSYNLDQQLLWYKKNLTSFIFNILYFIVCIIICFMEYVIKFEHIDYAILFLIYSIFTGIILVKNLPKKQKKPLVYTMRIKRLLVVTICIFVILGFICNNFIIKNLFHTFAIITACSPLNIFISYLIMLPIENNIRKRFMREGAKIVNDNNKLLVIGVTGSYGKTSVKYYLKKMLDKKFNVCITPESYNTAMGAVLTIKNDLKSYDDVFICEMGARRVGDVKEICDIVSPSACVITDVGNMHLDTFHNIENVRKCKFELLDSVYKKFKNSVNDNICFAMINGDNKFMLEKLKDYKDMSDNIYTYGFDTENDFVAQIVNSDCNGTKFNVKYKLKNNDSGVLTLTTKLLGKYNVMNLTAAIGYALILNVNIDDITSAINSVEAVPHRLQLLNYDNNNIIIDDAYNANPNGTKNSLDTISTFDNYIKIIITPGMVELGDKQEIENAIFAKYSKNKIDYAFVVGNTNKTTLISGFTEAIGSDKVIYFDDVNSAIFYARNNISGKKVILLENDLSDNY